MSETSDDTFQVCWSEKKRQAVKDLIRKAAERGLVDSLRDALTQIEERLRIQPLNWGDPTHRLKHTGWQMYHRVYSILYVQYAVDEQHRLVFVKEIVAMPRRGLD